ncbi:hypothetical protein QTP86_034715 [Hemibagrus guttatus]|nr:hypothetical protein QTP86_034715 [Hemibagrus guttatus]
MQRVQGTFWYSAPEGPNEPDNWKEEDPSGENCAALGDARDHSKVVASEILRERHDNATAKLMVLKYQATVMLEQEGIIPKLFPQSWEHEIVQNVLEFVASQIGETHWIGLNDLETEGQWMWVNNQPLNEKRFWYRSPQEISEPDNWKEEDPAGENCAALGHEEGFTNKWFDASCRKLKQFICEK